MACNTEYGKGRDLLLQAEDTEGSGTYTTIAALTENGADQANPSIDVSNKTAGVWRHTIAGGVRTLDISGTGIVTDLANGYSKLKGIHNAEDNCWSFRVIGIKDGSTITGPFRVTALNLTGAHDGAQEFNITLESAGEIVTA